MKKTTIYFLFCLIPAFSFGQWQQLGSSIIGTVDNDKLGSTHSIDIDSAGTTIAFGTAFNSDIFPYSGYAKVFDFNGTNWIQRGNTFVGLDSTLEGTGSAVSLSADGNTVAISSPWGYNNLGYKCGIVRVFDWNGTSWVQRGGRINGEGNIIPMFSGDVFGTSMELSANGNHLIVGARSNTKEVGVLQFQGHARVFNWNGTEWIQIGQDLDGNNLGGVQEFGYAVSINDDGNRIAVGARSYNTVAQGAGITCMYQFNGTNWAQIGDTLFGSTVGESLGSSVQMTRDGNSVAIGATGTNGIYVGAVKIYDWSGTNWAQRGATINAIGTSSSGSSIDLSADGKIIAIGEPWKNNVNGAVRLFQWNGSAWQQLGNTVTPTGSTSAINAFGSAVRMNAIGSRIVVGEPSYDGLGFNLGRITVHNNTTVLDINEVALSHIQLFPNPTQTTLTLISNDLENEEIIIFNALGQNVSERVSLTKISSKEINLDVSQLRSGLYTIKTVKMVKQFQKL